MSDELKTYYYGDVDNKLTYEVTTEQISGSDKRLIWRVALLGGDENIAYNIEDSSSFDKQTIEIVHAIYSNFTDEDKEFFFNTLDLGDIRNLSAKTFSFYMDVENKSKLTIYVDYFGSIIMIKESYMNEDGIWDMTRNAPGSMFFESSLEEFSTRIMKLDNKMYREFIDSLNDETKSEYFELKWIPKKH